jgi:hypothetical protein
MTTIGDFQEAVDRHADDNVSIGLVPQRTILSQVMHVLSLRQTHAVDLVAWTDTQWRALFADAFGADGALLRLSIIRALAEVKP